MYQTEMKIPDVLAGCESVEAWRGKREKILEELAAIEYGKRPELLYEVSWSEDTREEVEELQAVHLCTELTVKTEFGGITFPVTVFVPKLNACEGGANSNEKVPAAVLICSQSKSPQPMKVPPQMEGKSMPEMVEVFSEMLRQFGVVMEQSPMEMLTGMERQSAKNVAAAGMPATAERLNGGEGGMPVEASSAGGVVMPGLGAPVPLDLDKDYDNGHWPVREMMKQGMALVGFYANDVEKDDASVFPSGLAQIFGTKQVRGESEWGILAVWAFAASCVMDYVQSVSEIDGKRVAVAGHSRCGKAALWCGALDERFAAVMPNGSGCCGAALSRGKKGENVASIQAFFPHWFASAFKRYMGKEGELPFDQHFLLAAVAPRVLQVGSGSEDFWADPSSEYYATCLASKVWELYGNEPFSGEMPGENQMALCGKVGHHLRKGPHKLDVFDWECLFEHMKTES